MYILTKQERASLATQRWFDSYYQNGDWGTYGNDKESIYNKLKALGDTPNPDDVDEVIGNNSWTRLSCDECKESVDCVVVLGEIIPYEVDDFYLCFNCLDKVVKLVYENLNK